VKDKAKDVVWMPNYALAIGEDFCQTPVRRTPVRRSGVWQKPLLFLPQPIGSRAILRLNGPDLLMLLALVFPELHIQRPPFVTT